MLRSAAIITRLVNFCWSLFQWLLVLVVAAALLVGGYLYFRMDDEISRHVEHLLAKHYQHLDVHVGGARFEQGRGIAIYDVSFVQPVAGGAPQPLLSIDELFLACDVRLEQMITGDPPVDRIVVRRARLRAVRQLDGRWNIATLVPLPKFGDRTPDVVIEDATLILEDASRRQAVPLAVRGVDMTLTSVRQATQPSAAPPPKRFRVVGTASGLPAQELRFEGEASADDGALSLKVEIRGLEVSPELFAALPVSMPSQWQQTQVYGRANLSLRVERAGGAGAALDWSASLALSRGRLDYASLPQSLTELTIRAQANREKLVIQEMRGKCGSAEVALASERNGWAADAPISLAARVVDLSLDAKLRKASPASLTRLWQRFQPAGKVDADVRATFDGKRWQPTLTVQCRDVSFTDAEKFPYRLQQATGTVQLVPAAAGTGSDLRLDLLAQGGGRPIKLASYWANLQPPNDRPPTSHPVGWIDIAGEDIAIHEPLVAALAEKGERLVRSLRPEGAFDFHWRLQWDPDEARPQTALDLNLKDCSIRYDRFAYPLSNIHGLVTERNRHWTFHDVVSSGRQDATQVTCRGESVPEGEGSRLQLVFQGTNLPLDDNLRQAISPEAQKAWSELRPQGQVNFTAYVGHQTGQAKPQVQVLLEPHERSVSIEPKSFPYRLEQLEGQAMVAAERVEFKNIRARHGRATVSTQGFWQATPNGGWQLVFSGLNADRLTPQRDLLTAIPPGLQKVVDRLHPVGTFALYDGMLSFTKQPGVDRLLAAWNVQLDCHQATLQSGVPLESITGGIRLVGRSDERATFTTGELNIDSMIVKNVQLTDVHGPLWADNTVCLLGRPSTEKQGQPQRPITAQFYGGTLTCDVRLQCDSPSRYELALALGGANLTRIANERFGGPSNLGGIVSGTLRLSGTGNSTHALEGNGELHIVDANIYRLPVLVSLLKVIQIRTPDSTAFNSCDMQFSLQGEHIHFKQLNLVGDAVSLYGRGETNFDRELNLVFYSLVGPAKLPVPLLNTLVGKASQQIWQLKVSGTMANPKIEREAFPAVNQVLQQIQAELQEGATTVAPPTAARDLFAPQSR